MSPFTKKTTWEPTHHSGPHGRLNAAQLNALPDGAFAFPRTRKEPITDAAHVRGALARFSQVSDVSDADRDLAFANIRTAAEHFGIDMHETDWRQLGETSRSS